MNIVLVFGRLPFFCVFRKFEGVFSDDSTSGFAINSHIFSDCCLVGPLQSPAGSLQISFPLARTSTYATGHIALTMDFSNCGNIATDSLMVLLTKYSINLRGLPLSAVTVSLHCLTRSLRSTVTCKPNACYRNTKWTFEDLLPCYCNVIKTNSRTIRSQLLYLPLQAKAGTWVNCKLVIARHRNCEPDACAVWASLRQINCHSKN